MVFLLSLFVLNACSRWPTEGQGGMAEHHQQTLSPSLQKNKPLGAEHELRFDLELTSRHLDMLVLGGAELCFPATVVQAKLRQNRISRELQGALTYDAANDLIIQRNLLARLERQLDYVKKSDICILPINKIDEKKSKPTNKQTSGLSKEEVRKLGSTSEYIADLLNTDNQFAINSSELNPKYLKRLAEAVKLLNNIPHYSLLVTGHADASGTEDKNQQLAINRAKQVGHYLQVLGLPEGRLKFHAVGSDNPLFVGTEPHVELVNRRVSIELIEVSPLFVNEKE